jgi:hypothetical protein
LEKLTFLKMTMRKYLIPAALLLLANLASSARADEISQQGREIFQKNQRAVVTVEVVLKTTGGSGDRESGGRETRHDLTGTVVDPSGLTVLSLAACDPSEMYQRLMAEESSKPRVETEITDVKILLEDGSELPSEIVLRDQDLDLAFIRPKVKPASPMPAVDLSRSTPAQVLDEVLVLNRLNRAAGRAYSASSARINAVVQKPRTYYVPDIASSAASLGSPAFALNGGAVGVIVIRAVSMRGGGTGTYRDSMTTIILPAEDILKAAKQAPEAKGDDDKKEPAKDDTKPAGKEPAERK